MMGGFLTQVSLHLEALRNDGEAGFTREPS
jgi:hypothetical protein